MGKGGGWNEMKAGFYPGSHLNFTFWSVKHGLKEFRIVTVVDPCTQAVLNEWQ